MVSRTIFAYRFRISLNLTVYELLALPHSLLPTLRHQKAISKDRLQIWNQRHLLPLPTNLYRNLGVFFEIFRCTTYYGYSLIYVENVHILYHPLDMPIPQQLSGLITSLRWDKYEPLINSQDDYELTWPRCGFAVYDLTLT